MFLHKLFLFIRKMLLELGFRDLDKYFLSRTAKLLINFIYVIGYGKI